MSLSFRGIATLEKTGILSEILQIAIPMRGRMLHTVDGATSYQPYSNDSRNYLLSISRDHLNESLRAHAETRATFIYNAQVRDINARTARFKVRDTTDPQRKDIDVASDTIIACDGAYSIVRQTMAKIDRQELHQTYLEHGYKELRIPPAADGGYRLNNNALHVWPRGDYMMMALPNLDGSFTCTLFCPFDGPNSYDKMETPEQIDAFFRTNFPDAHAVMPTLVDDFETNPTCSLLTTKTYPWAVGGRTVLVGDAAHAIVPFYGQGMNAAFEDVLELYECIMEQLPVDMVVPRLTNAQLTAAYSKYQVRRRANSDAIADMAVENFTEMSDKVLNPYFIFKKKVERMLEQHFAGRYTSRAQLIAFSHVPYKEAQRIGRINASILEQLTKNCNLDIKQVDLEWAEKLISLMLDK
eukprot:gene4123-4814_t